MAFRCRVRSNPERARRTELRWRADPAPGSVGNKSSGRRPSLPDTFRDPLRPAHWTFRCLPGGSLEAWITLRKPLRDVPCPGPCLPYSSRKPCPCPSGSNPPSRGVDQPDIPACASSQRPPPGWYATGLQGRLQGHFVTFSGTPNPPQFLRTQSGVTLSRRTSHFNKEISP